MGETAGILIGWARLQGQPEAVAEQHVMDARVPVDASQRVKEQMFKKMIGKWLAWNRQRGWRIVTDIHVGKPRPALNTRTGRLIEGVASYPITGFFERTREWQAPK